MSYQSLGDRASSDVMRPSELRRFAVVLAARPAPISGVRVAGLESVDRDGPAAHRRPRRRFAIRPR